jgi:hypothetical protein
MGMETPQTCGRGLAEHSALPAKLAELTESVAVILDLHMKALDLTDENSRNELDAYRQLVNEHRDVAAQLHTTATEMAGYRDLPMGRHDPKAMAAPAVVDAFENFVKLEQELVTLLERRLGQDRQMLIQMRAAGGVR